MKLMVVLVAGFFAALPATATQLVQMAPVTAPGDCVDGSPDCVRADAAPAAEDETAMSTGPMVAGLAGLLVLGLVFGRRKAGLPEVVS
jgi:hypothetical protein